MPASVLIEDIANQQIVQFGLVKATITPIESTSKFPKIRITMEPDAAAIKQFDGTPEGLRLQQNVGAFINGVMDSINGKSIEGLDRKYDGAKRPNYKVPANTGLPSVEMYGMSGEPSDVLFNLTTHLNGIKQKVFEVQLDSMAQGDPDKRTALGVQNSGPDTRPVIQPKLFQGGVIELGGTLAVIGKSAAAVNSRA